MLLGVKCEIIKSVLISLVDSDKSVKQYLLSVDDIVNLSYMKDGNLFEINEGRIARIDTEPGHAGHRGHISSCSACKNEGVYIYIDESKDTEAKIKKIDADRIISIEIVRKSSSFTSVVSPAGCGNISAIRLSGNQLQISTDQGKTWLKVLDLPDSPIVVEDESDQELADRIAALIPGCVHAHEKQESVEALLALFKSELNDADDPARE